MIASKRIVKMARKWQKLAAAKRLTISFPRSESGLGNSTFVASKGHFVVYTTDEKRFMVPLELLSQNVFVELLRLSEEEFGLPSDGPITLPCDGAFFEYAISLVRGSIAVDLEKALLTSLTTCYRSASPMSAPQQNHQQTLIHGF